MHNNTVYPWMDWTYVKRGVFREMEQQDIYNEMVRAERRAQAMEESRRWWVKEAKLKDERRAKRRAEQEQKQKEEQQAKEHEQAAEQRKQEERWHALRAGTKDEKLRTYLHSAFYAKIKQQKKFKCSECQKNGGIIAFECPYCCSFLCAQCLTRFSQCRAKGVVLDPAVPSPESEGQEQENDQEQQDAYEQREDQWQEDVPEREDELEHESKPEQGDKLEHESKPEQGDKLEQEDVPEQEVGYEQEADQRAADDQEQEDNPEQEAAGIPDETEQQIYGDAELARRLQAELDVEEPEPRVMVAAGLDPRTATTADVMAAAGLHKNRGVQEPRGKPDIDLSTATSIDNEDGKPTVRLPRGTDSKFDEHKKSPKHPQCSICKKRHFGGEDKCRLKHPECSICNKRHPGGEAKCKIKYSICNKHHFDGEDKCRFRNSENIPAKNSTVKKEARGVTVRSQIRT
ncbi:hypothetical protein BU23DRAFT_653894 [Bimuria novae-zelandiae CBS 107.79]|uniref:Uncharacterized protein n=1 Tax=Bimuria novae-zelandiae CBS 107.79 TaxID=1447943 RepID=A0A6A5UWZ3_9PLEO|nr:hypothetical protein BU23DRAFT_653894 [Bimuria novae-zelandiae CBS 107.79]